MLELLYTSNKTVTPAGSLYSLVYIGSWDACLLLNSGRLDKLFRDGTQTVLGAVPASWRLGSRVSARADWVNGYGPDPSYLYAADEVTGQYCPGVILDPAWIVPGELKSGGHFLDDWQGIYAVNAGPGQVRFYSLADGSLLGSVQLESSLPYNSISYAGLNKIIVFQNSSGKVALVDYLNRTILWQNSVRPATVCAYDTRHNLIITVEADLKVRVYLITPLSAGLSDPEFYPSVPQVTRLQGYVVRVRLLDGNGVACAGKWVSWGTALGYLQKLKSQTDSEGYAWNYYFGPAAGTGENTITAEVTV